MNKKHWALLALALGAVLLGRQLPFRGTDVAKLRPVELLAVSAAGGEVTVATDTGDFGAGPDLESALAMLKDTTSGEVYLETVNYLLLKPGAEALLPQLAERDLRPSTLVCLGTAEVDPQEAAAFLAVHSPGVTLQQWRLDDRPLPRLAVVEGRLCLEGT